MPVDFHQQNSSAASAAQSVVEPSLYSPNMLQEPNFLLNGPPEMNGHVTHQYTMPPPQQARAPPITVRPPPPPASASINQHYQQQRAPPQNLMNMPTLYSSPYFMGLSYLSPQYIVPTVVRAAPPPQQQPPQQLQQSNATPPGAAATFVYPTRQPYFFCAPNVSATQTFIPAGKQLQQQNPPQPVPAPENFYPSSAKPVVVHQQKVDNYQQQNNNNNSSYSYNYNYNNKNNNYNYYHHKNYNNNYNNYNYNNRRYNNNYNNNRNGNYSASYGNNSNNNNYSAPSDNNNNNGAKFDRSSNNFYRDKTDYYRRGAKTVAYGAQMNAGVQMNAGAQMDTCAQMSATGAQVNAGAQICVGAEVENSTTGEINNAETTAAAHGQDLNNANAQSPLSINEEENESKSRDSPLAQPPSTQDIVHSTQDIVDPASVEDVPRDLLLIENCIIPTPTEDDNDILLSSRDIDKEPIVENNEVIISSDTVGQNDDNNKSADDDIEIRSRDIIENSSVVINGDIVEPVEDDTHHIDDNLPIADKDSDTIALAIDDKPVDNDVTDSHNNIPKLHNDIPKSHNDIPTKEIGVIEKNNVEDKNLSNKAPIIKKPILYSDRVAGSTTKVGDQESSAAASVKPKSAGNKEILTIGRPPDEHFKWKNRSKMSAANENLSRKQLDTGNKDDFPLISTTTPPVGSSSQNVEDQQLTKNVSDSSASSTFGGGGGVGKSWASLFKSTAAPKENSSSSNAIGCSNDSSQNNNSNLISHSRVASSNPIGQHFSTNENNHSSNLSASGRKSIDSLSMNGDNKSTNSESTTASGHHHNNYSDIVGAKSGFTSSSQAIVIAASHQISKPKSNTTYTTMNNNLANDDEARKIGVSLQSYQLVHRGSPYQLRGLVNGGSWCYVNSTLQALIACPPFVHLLRDMQIFPPRHNSSTPTMDALIKFAAEFSDKIVRRGPQDLDIGPSFTPVYVYDLLSALNKESTSFKGSQEDAEEFLSFLLNNLHEEMTNCINSSAHAKINHHNSNDNSEEPADDNGEEWQQVGPNKKAMVTRSSKLITSPIANIFSGLLRITVQQSASKPSANLESFFVLPLDIQSDHVSSIEDALQYMHKENMKVIKGKNEVRVTRWTMFQELPAVLILQLKYFISPDGQTKKLFKPIEYGVDLQIDRTLVSSSQNVRPSRFSRSYKLCAVIYHHGETVENGHYTVNIFHGGFWVNVDDERIKPVDELNVLGAGYRGSSNMSSADRTGQDLNGVRTGQDLSTPRNGDRIPYLLFYRRCDIMSDNYGSRRN